jgi:hypothetical protein
MVVGNLDVGFKTLLVNAYALNRETHRLVWKTAKKKILTHYQFRRAITITWLTGKSTTKERENQGMKQKLSYATVTSTLSLSMEKKVPRINDSSLDPTMGALCGRLNDNVLHYPEATTVKQACCSLCHLVNPNKNVRTYSLVFQCDQCWVNLCVACFKQFHTIASVKHLKSFVMSVIKQKAEGNH